MRILKITRHTECQHGAIQ